MKRQIIIVPGVVQNLVTIDQGQFLAPTDARLVGGSQIQQPQQQAFSRSAGSNQTQPLPLAHQATISPLDKYYGQSQQAAQPLATNATINGNSNKQISNEIDEKLRSFNVSVFKKKLSRVILLCSI